VQVVQFVESGIADGTYPPGSVLPPERDLALQLKVSRKTIRTAMGELESRGRVSREVGRGTFVMQKLPQSPSRPFLHAGIVFLKYTNPFQDPLTVRMFDGMYEVFQKEGIVCTTYGLSCAQGDDYEALVSDVAATSFDALIVSPEALEWILEKPFGRAPLFQIGYGIPGAGRNYVAGDLFAGMRTALQALRELRHRHICFMSLVGRRAAEGLSVPVLKIRAFEQAVAEVGGGEVRASVISGTDLDQLFGPGRPSAVITSETTQAKAVLARAQEIGVRIPAEMSLISFDDGDIGVQTTPRFSGIRVLSREVGRRGAEALAQALRGSRQTPVQELIEPEFLIRETCAEAPRPESVR
jgi:LacI family transcriptional regulator